MRRRSIRRKRSEGIAATLDSLGESVTTEAEAQKSAAIYHQLLDAIEARKLNANVSVKLTQMGMDLDHGLAGPLRGNKLSMFEGGYRVPGIGLPRSAHCDAIAHPLEREEDGYRAERGVAQ